METVATTVINIENHENAKRIISPFMLFLRQMFVCGSVILNFFIYGLYIGAPTIIIPQIRKEAGSDNIITPEMASWLSSVSAFSSLPYSIILPLIAHRFGRKTSLVLLTINTLIGNLIFYRSRTYTELLISQIIQGMVISASNTLSVMVLSEYSLPCYRGLILTFKGATFFWGIWISNALGSYLEWRTIGILIFVCCTYNLSLPFCPESPYWLAMKGRFDECAKSHRWIKGTDRDSEKELRVLISTQKKYLNKKSMKSQTANNIFIKMYKVIGGKKFYRPLFYMMLAICLYHFSGKLACTVYIIDIIKNITSNEEIAYKGMLILDGITVLAAYVGCFLTYFLKRRTQLFFFSCVAICFLLTISTYLYSIKLNLISENKYVSLLFLSGSSISLNCGPVIISTSCLSELTPLKHRTPFLIVFGILGPFILGLILKLSPFVFKTIDYHGAFLFYAITSSICLIGLYKYLPETKNRTIQEIESIIAEECTTIEDGENFSLKSLS